MDTTRRSKKQVNPNVQPSAPQTSSKPPRPHIPLNDVAQNEETHRCPDELLRQSIFKALNHLGYRQFGHLDVEVTEGRVRMTGKVSRFYWRQLAENAVIKTVGVRELESEVEVMRQ
jgi:osmotically-inducible protein OsmY